MDNAGLLDFFDEGVEKARANVLGDALEMQKEEFEHKVVKLDVFKDILPSLWTYKKHLINEDNEKQYVPFLVNRMMSYHADTLFFANEMNTKYQLDNRLQYDFYYACVRAKKRGWAKWIKPINHPDLAAVKLYFGYSRAKAMAALNILTEDDLIMIRKATTVGE